MHPDLTVTEHAPCGCRGVVAACDITSSSCEPMWKWHSNPPVGPNGVHPLIAVPEQLCMTDDDAIVLLSQAMEAPPGTVITKDRNSSSHHSAGSASDSPADSAAGPALLLHQALNRVGGLLHLLSLLGGTPGGSSLQQRLHQLQPPMLLALLLAQQRRLGEQSFWHAYISNLPERPPCAWFDSVDQQLTVNNNAANSHSSSAMSRSPSAAAAAIPAAGGAAALDSKTLEAAAAAAVAAKCAAAAGVFDGALGGITAAEVAWAYGQVVSRAFATGGGMMGNKAGIALLPVIDMLNHAAGAAVPVCWQEGDVENKEVEQEGGQQRAGQHLTRGALGTSVAKGTAQGGESQEGVGFWCVWHQQLTDWPADADADSDGAASSTVSSTGGTESGHSTTTVSSSVGANRGDEVEEELPGQVILQSGQELYISYMSSVDAAAALLSFGFIPPELTQP